MWRHLSALCLLVGCVSGEPSPGPELREPIGARPAVQSCLPLVDGAFVIDLDETGCFDDGAAGPDLVPFWVRSPLWSDGAEKHRWMVVPPDQAILAPPSAPWTFPPGSVLLKRFDAAPGRPIETRAMVAQADGWRFASWRWEDGVATLLDDLLIEPVTMGDGAEASWVYPDAAGCRTCHAAGAIGPVSAQLDLDFDYGDGVRSQIDELAAAGLLDGGSVGVAPLPDVDAVDQPLGRRARSWLHANCAHCHAPGGWSPPEMDMDLRYGTPLLDARLCGVPVQFATAPLAGAYRLSPGDTEDSAIWGRPATDGLLRMPPIGVSLTDPHLDRTVRAWITGLGRCDSEG